VLEQLQGWQIVIKQKQTVKKKEKEMDYSNNLYGIRTVATRPSVPPGDNNNQDIQGCISAQQSGSLKTLRK
jgi:hypothetical protein